MITFLFSEFSLDSCETSAAPSSWDLDLNLRMQQLDSVLSPPNLAKSAEVVTTINASDILSTAVNAAAVNNNNDDDIDECELFRCDVCKKQFQVRREILPYMHND